MTAVRVRREGEWPLPGDLAVMRLPAGEPFPPGWTDGWTHPGDSVGTRRVWRVVTEHGEHIRYRHPWVCYVQPEPPDPASTGVPWEPPADDIYTNIARAKVLLDEAAPTTAVRLAVGADAWALLRSKAEPAPAIAGIPTLTAPLIAGVAVTIDEELPPYGWRTFNAAGEAIGGGELPAPRIALEVYGQTVEIPPYQSIFQQKEPARDDT